MTPPRTGPGRVVRVSGPLVEMEGLGNVAMSELVGLGPEGLLAEVVGLDGDRTTVQAYEYTGGLAVGDPARRMGRPLSARLGPHLLGGVFDGLLRPLSDGPVWLVPGAATGGTAQPQLWTPLATEGTRVDGGAVLGTATAPSRSFVCRVLVPPGVSGTIDLVAPAGTVDLDDTVARVGATTVRLSSWWPVRRPRPVGERLTADEPLVTGQRVLDALFPLALGGRAAVPGGFGTGKTMLLQQVAKWCSADVIVYVGCGE
ncbi:MAG: ATPase, partial [Actinobacteria bacterium]|nr:ATPase [Actinomycetota bacterium]